MRGRVTTVGLIFAAALAVAGCSGSSALLDKDTYSQAFSKKLDLFTAPEWASLSRSGDNAHLGPTGPVAPENLVSADGRCAAPVEAAQAAQAQAQAEAPAATPAAAAPTEPATVADRPVGSVAGDLAGAPMPAGPAPAPRKVLATTGSAAPSDRLEPEAGGGGMPAPGAPLLGGIALGMTECDVVRRAGQPGNVAVGSDGKGERKVVLSYLDGNWPGIYHFESGRLKEIDAAPVQAKPAKAKAKKIKKKREPQKSARHEVERAYVQ